MCSFFLFLCRCASLFVQLSRSLLWGFAIWPWLVRFVAVCRFLAELAEYCAAFSLFLSITGGLSWFSFFSVCVVFCPGVSWLFRFLPGLFCFVLFRRGLSFLPVVCFGLPWFVFVYVNVCQFSRFSHVLLIDRRVLSRFFTARRGRFLRLVCSTVSKFVLVFRCSSLF